MKEQNNWEWEKKGAIGVMSLNNPPDNLIIDPEFIRKELLEEILDDPSLKGIIIKGTGRHFSAGADMIKLKELTRNELLLAEKLTTGKSIIKIIDNINVPVVAAISGVCFGAGLEIALSCHIRICSENALFAFPETNHGLMPGLGGTVMLTKLIGAGKATEMVLTGDLVNSQKAFEMKLADYVVQKNELEEYAMNFLVRLTIDRDIDVIHSVMQSIHNSQTLSFDKALEEETRLFCSLAIKSMQ
jgi:enoyl-CoA hydratase/carnithine racemase